MSLTNYNAKRTIYVFLNGTQDCQITPQIWLWRSIQRIDDQKLLSMKPERRRVRARSL